MEALECGAASLCMVLAHYGKWMPLEKVRSDCGVSRDGSKAGNVVKAARSYGMEAKGFRKEPEDLRNIPLPAIIHWNFNHFVVLCGFTKKKAIINDPAKGKVEVPLEEFDKAYTGVVLTFAPTEAFAKEGRAPSVLAFAAKRLRGMTAAFLFVMLASIVGAVLSMTAPIYSRFFMDRILSGNAPEYLI
jgi:ABC-type bacteriocin/lantibiotic exporter with double-glycine peptidase domain